MSSNFASRFELGRERILNFITCQALKSSERLNKLPAKKFMKLTNPSSMKFTDAGILQNSMRKLNVSETNLDCRDVPHNISKKYSSHIYEEINLFKRQINDNKLHTYSKIYDSFCLQSYLSFELPKSLTEEFTEVRIRVHD